MVFEINEEMMPTYDYQCTKCDNKIEEFHGMNEYPIIKCHKCNSIMKRMIGKGAGVHFKGTGFYETDYKRKTE